jgi:uncharacterized Zn finger protein
VSWRYGFWREFYPKSRPRRAKGGIRAQSKRGSFGESWWAKRWIEVIEGFSIGGRLGRGRSYARQGQVLSIDVGKGRVTSKVQGSRPRPYEVEIRVKTLSQADWKKAAGALARDAGLAAKLLAGTMPEDVEKALARGGVPLFPKRSGDLRTDCSCPDWSNPCKHVAAVYYLLAEEFDRDPFLVFKLRGMTREGLVALIGGGRKEKAARKSRRAAGATAPPAGPPEPTREALPTDARAFWSGADIPNDLFGEVRAPAASAALVKRLGSFPFWRGTEPFVEAMEGVCAGAASRGMDAFLCGR